MLELNSFEGYCNLVADLAVATLWTTL